MDLEAPSRYRSAAVTQKLALSVSVAPIGPNAQLVPDR